MSDERRSDTETRVSALLEAAKAGDRAAVDELFDIVYKELHALARSQRRRWEGDYTMNTTALVHEAYLKLAGPAGRGWRDRSHFLAVAAKSMRHVLVDYAERRSAQKRGGDRVAVSLDDTNPVAAGTADEMLALDQALTRLEQLSERQARVVELRFFTGLGVDETAEVLGISRATVKRDWALAGAWLHRELSADDRPS